MIRTIFLAVRSLIPEKKGKMRENRHAYNAKDLLPKAGEYLILALVSRFWLDKLIMKNRQADFHWLCARNIVSEMLKVIFNF